MEVFDRLGNTVVDKLNKLDANEPLEFYPLAVLYALDVMCGEWVKIGFTLLSVCLKKNKIYNIYAYFCHTETAMGVSIDALRKPNSEYVNAVHK